MMIVRASRSLDRGADGSYGEQGTVGFIYFELNAIIFDGLHLNLQMDKPRGPYDTDH